MDPSHTRERLTPRGIPVFPHPIVFNEKSIQDHMLKTSYKVKLLFKCLSHIHSLSPGLDHKEERNQK